MKVAAFDDTVSTGGSLLAAIDAVEAFGCEVVLVMAVLDRHQGGGDELDGTGLERDRDTAQGPQARLREPALELAEERMRELSALGQLHEGQPAGLAQHPDVASQASACGTLVETVGHAHAAERTPAAIAYSSTSSR